MAPFRDLNWKVFLLFLAAVLIAAYGAMDIRNFLGSPFTGIYGDYVAGGYRIDRIVDPKSSAPLKPGMVIAAIEGRPLDARLRESLHFPPGPSPFQSPALPLELTIQTEKNTLQKVTVFQRVPTLDDLLQGPLWLWSLAVFILFCGIYLAFRYPRQERVRILSLLLLAAALSIFNNSGKHFLLQVGPQFPVIFALRLLTIGVIFSSWLYLILIFIEKQGPLHLPRWAPWSIYLLPPCAALAALSFSGGNPLSGLEASYRILYLVGGGVVFFTFGILFQTYRKTRDAIFKAQLKWLLWGHILGMSPYIFLYSLPKALGSSPLLSYSLSLAPFPFIVFSYFFAFYRYRLMDVDRVIHGSIVYGISVGLLISLYLLAITALHHRIAFPSVWESWFRADLLLLLGIALIFNPLKNLIRRGIDRALFPEKRGLPVLLMEGTRRLSRASDSAEIAGFMLKNLPDGMGVEKASLVLRQQFGEEWEFRNRPEAWIEKSPEMVSCLDGLSRGDLPQFWDALSSAEKFCSPGALELFKARGVSLIIPLSSGDDLWGFYILGNKTANNLLTSEEIHVLGTLCTQAAHMVGNARLLEGLQRTNRSLADLSNRLMQAERMADLGEGAAILAHEMKTPLGILRGSAEVLLKGKEQSRQNEILQFILEEVDRLTATVNDFLQFARMPPPSKSEADLNGLVQSAAFLWESRRKNQKPVAVRFQIDPAVGKIPLDSRQIYQVLLNIFANSEEAMPGGGELLIATGIDSGGGRARITVKDTGKGIARDHLPRVCDRFFTTKDSGMGLGLAVVKKIMEDHGGSVTIESSPGDGTEVALYFPQK